MKLVVIHYYVLVMSREHYRSSTELLNFFCFQCSRAGSTSTDVVSNEVGPWGIVREYWPTPSHWLGP
jgi:hypothetical protein